MFKVIPREDYKSVPWENGRGVTSDVLLLPEGATRQNFDIRISVAPITADGPFSQFPGMDRHITLFKGTGLQLDFPACSLTLRPLAPAYFDNGEPPFARLVDGPVEVLNVMTRRGRWAAHVEVLQQDMKATVNPNEIGIIFASHGKWIAECGGTSHDLQNGGTGVVTKPSEIALAARGSAAAIFALLAPV